MKSRTATFTALAILFMPPVLAEEVKMRDAARHEDLVKVQRAEMAEGRRAEPPAFVAAEGEDPSVSSKPQSLLKRSEIISFRGKATLVPKRALLHVPPSLSERVGQMEGCRLVAWDEFYRENAGWINTHEVSISIASGEEVIPDESKEQFVDRGRIVVATLMKGPVSVLPLKVVEDEVDVAETAAVQD